ncbi:MAG TPA: hypothetical protein VD763_09825, partial [Candidatus Saccharimonadales bacterium]|nr:hypothetical protein [Candidatus Saccharimonadales bacterium]
AGLAGFGGDGGPAGTMPLMDRAHRPMASLSTGGLGLHARFAAAIDDDLDLPTALAVVREMVRADGLSDDERRWLVLDADAVLGLDLDRVWGDARTGRDADPASEDAVPAEVQAALDARTAARANRDFTAADALRDRLEAMGWTVVDGPAGSTVRRAD